MQTRAQLWIVVAAFISLGAGAALSRVVEPGVRVEKVALAGNTLALRLFPAAPGPHPVALLAHGNGGNLARPKTISHGVKGSLTM